MFPWLDHRLSRSPTLGTITSSSTRVSGSTAPGGDFSTISSCVIDVDSGSCIFCCSCMHCNSSSGCFSSSAFFNLSLTSSTLLVRSPPHQMRTAAPIPQRNAPGIRTAVVHGGRSNLYLDRPSCQPVNCHKHSPIHAPHSPTKKSLNEPKLSRSVYGTGNKGFTWNTEFPSFKKQIQRATLMGNA